MKKLRRALALVLCILLTVFCAVTVSADSVSYRIKELNMSIKIPDTLTVYTRENTENMAESIYLEATNADSSLTITVSMIENEKTKEIYSFENLSSSALEDYKDQMLEIDGYLSCNTGSYGSVPFLDFDQKFTTDNGGVIYGKQSVTLVSGMTISISSQSPGDSFTSDELGLIKGCLESIKFHSLNTSAPSKVSFWSVFLWILGVVLILGIAFLVLSFYMGRRSTQKKQEARREKRKKESYDVLKQADQSRRRRSGDGNVSGYKTSSDYFDSDFDGETSRSHTADPAVSASDSRATQTAEKAVRSTHKAFTHMGYFFKNLKREINQSQKNKKKNPKKSKKTQNRRRQSRDYDVFSDR